MRNDGNIEKLPKWAREEIEYFKRQVHERDVLISELRTVTSTDATSGIIVDPLGSHPLYHAPDNTVRLWLDPGKFAVDVHVRRSMYAPQTPHLHISGYATRSVGTIIVYPLAANCLAVGPER